MKMKAISLGLISAAAGTGYFMGRLKEKRKSPLEKVVDSFSR